MKVMLFEQTGPEKFISKFGMETCKGRSSLHKMDFNKISKD